MSQLFSCLLMLPVLADAGWADYVSTSSKPGESSYPVRVASAAEAVAPAPQPAASTPRQLPPPRRSIGSPAESPTSVSAGKALTTVVGSLAVVLAVFFLVAWITRRATPRHLRPLPAEVIECLGRAPLAGRQQMQLVRLGRKLVLLSVTNTDARPLCEVTDPLEVDRLAGLCEQTRPESVTANFRQILAACASDRTSRGTVAGEGASASRSEVRSSARERKA
jgi:flagellar biogenesis protein FliO